MKLKNILYSSAVVAVAALFTACSDIFFFKQKTAYELS